MDNIENITPEEPSKIKDYKLVCAKLGFIMCIFFICKILAEFIAGLFARVYVAGYISENIFYITNGTVSATLIYIVPILVAAALFGSFSQYGGKWKELYQRPRRTARALGNFPAMYGLGYGTALLTILAFFIIRKIAEARAAVNEVSGEVEINEIIEELFNPMTVSEQVHPNMVYAVVLFLMMVIAAPIFEEFLCRGILYDALKTYGDGIAIIVTSILFGLMHGSFYMLPYTTAIGFALGYVRYATGSLWAVTVLHALLNVVSAGVIFLMSLTNIYGNENKLANTVYTIYQVAALILILVGIIAFLIKIPVIRKYKIKNSWQEISGGRKFLLFIFSLPVILSVIIAADVHLNNMLLGRLTGFLT